MTVIGTLDPESVIGGVYRIVRLLGRGGAGDVYEAVHQRTGASLAIKILRAGLLAKSDSYARFQREAEVTSRLHHPNIVKVFDFDCLPDGRPFLVMELLSGTDLGSIIKAREPFSPARVLGIAEQVAMALATTHAMGVVHRDLSPGNVFIERLDGTQRELVRVLDFGISKVHTADGGLTHTTTIMGTPYYMSPEQAQGHAKETDARADQFALGAIVYEMFAGRRAFSSDDPSSDDPATAILYRVVHHDPPSFASLGVDLPAPLEAVVRKAMAKDPAQRYPSVLDFSDALIATAWESGLTEERIDVSSDSGSSPGSGGGRRRTTSQMRTTGPTWTTPSMRTTGMVPRVEAGDDAPVRRGRMRLVQRATVLAVGALASIAVVVAASRARAPRRTGTRETMTHAAAGAPAGTTTATATATTTTTTTPMVGPNMPTPAPVGAVSGAARSPADLGPEDKRPPRHAATKRGKRQRTLGQPQRTHARPHNEDIY